MTSAHLRRLRELNEVLDQFEARLLGLDRAPRITIAEIRAAENPDDESVARRLEVLRDGSEGVHRCPLEAVDAPEEQGDEVEGRGVRVLSFPQVHRIFSGLHLVVEALADAVGKGVTHLRSVGGRFQARSRRGGHSPRRDHEVPA